MTEWMIVYSTNDLIDAQIVVGRLEVEGIKAFTQQESLGGIYGISYGALGGINVLVNPSDYDDATAILEPDDLDALPENSDDVIYYDLSSDDENDAE
jgi:hypothetical protein